MSTISAQQVMDRFAIRTIDDLSRLSAMLAKSGYFSDSKEAAQCDHCSIGTNQPNDPQYLSNARPVVIASFNQCNAHRIFSHSKKRMIEYLESLVKPSTQSDLYAANNDIVKRLRALTLLRGAEVF